MKLPAGTGGRVLTPPHKEGMIQELKVFTGAIEIDSDKGRGFLLARTGELIAAYYTNRQGTWKGKPAAQYVLGDVDTEEEGIRQNIILRAYGSGDFAEARALCAQGGLLIDPEYERGTTVPEEKGSDSARQLPSPLSPLNEALLAKIASQPGVIAVSAFYEGFPVLSRGEADFEHVAALAEDFIRAGSRIAADMDFGPAEQLILETAEKKVIIAPCGDLSLCVIARADVQLGLLRVAIRSLQSE
ncbi:roadblock/LC7 domain-containing protein [Methanoregula sp. UBA64]|jgi:predicted regulator of Ras-like GTPase activity (Roadblock/LC7/MglB family)|uniref:roadblock/LC7 domain-containing protein n=1 Tax=Methanoregula sp. UBA64 TaxID=1915554 RepID=UPI0025F1107A|nr:roadblock/LC7 domain-containing protein [Methanoregula sp. UBA64]